MEEENDAFFNFDRESEKIKRSGILLGNVEKTGTLRRQSRTMKNTDDANLGRKDD